MRTFTVYRPNPPERYLVDGHANEPDQPQFEGVEFSDGTVAIRWLTPFRSTSLWADIQTLWAVHGHSEYSSYVVWGDGMRENV